MVALQNTTGTGTRHLPAVAVPAAGVPEPTDRYQGCQYRSAAAGIGVRYRLLSPTGTDARPLICAAQRRAVLAVPVLAGVEPPVTESARYQVAGPSARYWPERLLVAASPDRYRHEAFAGPVPTRKPCRYRGASARRNYSPVTRGGRERMAGTRRGPEGSGRRTRAELRPQERRNWLAKRMNAARNDRERVSLASEYLRSVMADRAVSDEQARQMADQAVKFLIALADQHQAATTPRGKR